LVNITCAQYYEPFIEYCASGCQLVLAYNFTTGAYDESGRASVSAFPPPTTGDTMGCRTYHGSTPAFTNPSYHCPHASMDGGGVCGTHCGVYCDLVQRACPTVSEGLKPNCTAACASINTTIPPAAQGAFLAATGDNIYCRETALQGILAQLVPSSACATAGPIPYSPPCGAAAPTPSAPTPSAPTTKTPSAPTAAPTAPSSAVVHGISIGVFLLMALLFN